MRLRLIAAALVLAPLAAFPAPFPSNVWVTGPMAKVQPSALPGSQHNMSIYAARNEFESFQVHVRAGAAPIQLNVSVADFVSTGTRTTIPAAANVTVFREAYLNITTPSDLNGLTGLVPDALIPAVDPYFHETRSAFPFRVAPNTTQSVWIDVFVPPDSTPGSYTSTVTVYDGTSAIAAIPVTLTVWAFQLPSTATLKSAMAMTFGDMCFFPDVDCSLYPGLNNNGYWGELGSYYLEHVVVATFFLDHRVSISQAVINQTDPAQNPAQFDSLFGPLINGTAGTILKGARLTTVSLQDYQTPPSVNDWDQYFRARGWFQNLYAQTCDEPPYGCTWDTALSASQAIHADDPQFQTMITTSIEYATQHGLLDAVDILTPVLEYVQPMGGPSTRSAYDAWLQQPNKDIWWYQACNQHGNCVNGQPGSKANTWPSYMVDASPVRNRIFQWMAWLYDIHGELYYAVDVWPGGTPWQTLYYVGGNGDGSLFYPGSVDIVGGTTPIPIASMRLKLIRDGMEDYEYLNALSVAGHPELASLAIKTFITNAYTFTDDPTALTNARQLMGIWLNSLASR